MQPANRKTALAFHAKDDLPEVRRDVFRLLRDTEGLRFFAVVADKLSDIEYVRQRNKREPTNRYHPNELYDYLTERLFKERLSQHDRYDIIFSKRGKSDRLTTLRQLIETARTGMAAQQNMSAESLLLVYLLQPQKNRMVCKLSTIICLGSFRDSMSGMRNGILATYGKPFGSYMILTTRGKQVMVCIT